LKKKRRKTGAHRKTFRQSQSFGTIVADPPWQKNQSAGGSYGAQIKYYDLMSFGAN
jgi:hypothetical protein